MRKLGLPSEIGRLVAPVFSLLDGAWQRMHWWVATMAILYALSGITIVRPDEVAVILRWGSLVGDTPALQEHGPGLLFAMPRPIDRVVRVQVKHVWEVAVGTLTSVTDDEDDEPNLSDTLNPVTEGYALTGDHNIVQVVMVARYRVRNPAEWAFLRPASRRRATRRGHGRNGSFPWRDGHRPGTRRWPQEPHRDGHAARTSRSRCLPMLVSSCRRSSSSYLSPPMVLAKDFDAVQSAYIGAETQKKDAEAFAETAIPQAQAKAGRGGASRPG
jgi:hypothetical protein